MSNDDRPSELLFEEYMASNGYPDLQREPRPGLPPPAAGQQHRGPDYGIKHATGLIRAAVLTILGEGPRWIQSWPFALGLVVVGAVLCWIGSRQRFST